MQTLCDYNHRELFQRAFQRASWLLLPAEM
jgi:hypothetical protein